MNRLGSSPAAFASKAYRAQNNLEASKAFIEQLKRFTTLIIRHPLLCDMSGSQSSSQLSDSLRKDIEISVDAERSYGEFISERKQQESTRDTPTRELDTAEPKTTQNAKLEKNVTARVRCVQWREYKEQFEVVFETATGSIESEQVSSGYPRHPSDEWVRLCQLTGTHPDKPADLRGKIIPITATGIDIPPTLKRLNPLKYRVSRLKHKASSRYLSSDNSTVLPMLISAVGHLLFIIVSTGMLYGAASTSSLIMKTVIGATGLLTFLSASVSAIKKLYVFKRDKLPAIRLLLGFVLYLIAGVPKGVYRALFPE